MEHGKCPETEEPNLDSSYAFSPGQDIENLTSHIQYLKQKLKDNLTGFDCEFKFIESQSTKLNKPKDFTAAFHLENFPKNRYKNVLPPDKTRVKLQNETNCSDYINASHIVIEYENIYRQKYISTQGPVPSTVPDFWRMVWQNDVRVIVMLTKEVESGSIKCAKYWPDSNSITYQDIKVVHCYTRDANPDILTRIFRIEHLEPGTGPRTLIHYQYTEWPDHGLPSSTKLFLELVHRVNRHSGKEPILVHCSAGIGRSGTFCTVHSVVNMMRRYVVAFNSLPKLNIVKTVLCLRSQRPGMVQNKDQYMFCYFSIHEEYLRCKEILSSLSTPPRKQKS
ncbi:tyrosine-protein phosphatase 2-like [Schistocerca gregaria]|uniref:tyrosine-protein phosphatase 2-like n=1 Tax=Schistocerca gregaria TaxID=7010 RepID=UPI00211E9BF0|nr:tyrosine-protein phosphatase 2-like [Schistocerca gregaria]